MFFLLFYNAKCNNKRFSLLFFGNFYNTNYRFSVFLFYFFFNYMGFFLFIILFSWNLFPALYYIYFLILICKFLVFFCCRFIYLFIFLKVTQSNYSYSRDMRQLLIVSKYAILYMFISDQIHTRTRRYTLSQ